LRPAGSSHHTLLKGLANASGYRSISAHSSDEQGHREIVDAAGASEPGAAAEQAASAEDDLVLSEVVRLLVQELHPERVYLFGSRARGDARVDSDYDVLLLVRERTGEGTEMESRAYGELWGVHWPVDIVILTEAYYDWMLGAAASLPSTVKREGRLLYAA